MLEKNFLIELYTEETPANLQLKIIQEFEKKFDSEMKKINHQAFEIKYYISCFRLIVYYKGLENINSSLIEKILENSLNSVLKILPRTLQWPNSSFKWIRPIRNLLFLTNDGQNKNKLHCFHLQSNNFTFTEKIIKKEISSIDEYFELLKTNNIIFDHKEREERIANFIKDVEIRYNVLSLANKNLLDEINGIVEVPYVIEYKIPERFQILPKELIKLILEKNQKYILFKTLKNELSHIFIIIANGKVENLENVKNGNIKVLNARLEDAMYYIEQDRKSDYDDLNSKLLKKNFIANTTYNDYFNLQYEILNNLTNIEKEIILGVKFLIANSKMDLATNVISEFPELSGIIASYYFQSIWYNIYNNSTKNTNKGLADIIRIQYNRYKNMKFLLNNKLEEKDLIERYFLIIDRISYIVEMFNTGNKPTSSGDPYAVKNKIDDLIYLKCDISLKSYIPEEFYEELIQLICKRLENIIYKEFSEKCTFVEEDLKLEKKYISRLIQNTNWKDENINISSVIDQIENTLHFVRNKDFIKTYNRIIGFAKKDEKLIPNKLISNVQLNEEMKNILTKELNENLYNEINNFMENNQIINETNKTQTQINLNFINQLFRKFNDIVDYRIII